MYINGFGLDKLEKFNQNLQPTDLVATGIFVSALAAVVFSALIMAVFGAYLLILIGRLIRLWILIILSPLAFALEALPNTAGFAGGWWSELGDNLVTGPVLMFFMWLSLAVVGSGNLNDHVAQYSQIPSDQRISQDSTNIDAGNNFGASNADSEKAKAQSAGLTEILMWSNLANFIIAICLLFAGAEVASKIGGSSGNLMGAALSFGKKVATIATGAAVGRWAYDHISGAASSAPGYIADKLLLDPMRRRATAMGGRLSLMRGKIEEWQSTQAVAWEQKGTLGKIGAWLIESSGRKMKKAEDWQDAAKYQAKIVEETYSTSSLTAGKIKLDTAERAQMVEHMAAAGKDLKFAKKETEMEHIAQDIDETKKNLEIAKNFEEKKSNLNEAKEDLDVANKSKDPKQIANAQELFNQAQNEFQSADKSMIKKDGKRISAKEEAAKMAGFKDVDILYAQRRSKMLQSKAEAEELKKRIHDQESIAIGAARDAYLVKNKGVDGGYQDQAEQAISEEAVKRAGVASWDKSMAKVEQINKKILELQSEIKDEEKKVKNGNLSEDIRKDAKNNIKSKDKLLKSLRIEHNNSVMASHMRGALFGVNAEQRALESSKRNIYEVGADLNEDNLAAAQANFLSNKLGRDIPLVKGKAKENREAIAKALADLEEMMGEAYVAQIPDALNNMAEQGATHFAGLFKGKMNTEGKWQISATDLSDDENRQYVEGKKDWAISQSKVGKIHGFTASIDNDVVTDKDGVQSVKHRIKSKAARNNVAKIFASLTSNNLGNVDQNNIDTLALAVKNAENADEINQIIEAIKNVGAGQKGQKGAMINALGKRIAKSSAMSNATSQNLRALLEATKFDEKGEEQNSEEQDEFEGAEAATTPTPKPPKAPRDTTSRPKRG